MTKEERKLIATHAATLSADDLRAQVKLFSNLATTARSEFRIEIWTVTSEIYANRFGIVLATEPEA